MSKTTKTIKKILIANRGEIACRVIKTARKMGIATVAVYSDADRKALHVRMADEAVHIGASPAIESYLVIEKIVKAAKDTGADAIHPGYGFLSENPDFVLACQKAKITFIGPSPESMEAMGLKDAAKKLMDKAGVPTTPGYHGEDQSPKLLRAKAGMIGYPVLIKAVAGGGGKGMRKVESDKDFNAALASCQREAKSSFGNDQVLIEKYITSPRHIEVQVFGDSHGNVVHMFERDCSLQRRHQKVIEEAPAPGMTDAVRKAMTDAAINAAKAVDYVGAGTVEFIVDGSGKLRKDGFWFMEMNTRLQVEHPVTEMITGLDLVELQIRVAQGEKLPKQKDIKMEGHAVEARVYAEDPANDFLPTTGKIQCFDDESWTNGAEIYRIDTGVEQYDKVSIHYDPMIAKLITFAEDREDAIDNLIDLIDYAEIFGDSLNGLKTNSGFLRDCLSHTDFQKGKINTHFISNNEAVLLPKQENPHDELYALAGLYIEQQGRNSASSPFNDVNGWRLNAPKNETYLFQGSDGLIRVRLGEKMDKGLIVYVGREGRETDASLFFDLDAENEDLPNDKVWTSYRAWAFKRLDDHISVMRNSKFYQVPLPSHDVALSVSSNTLTAPMPGKIIAVNAKAGDTVKAGEPLIVMEAMKMEMSLEAPRDGVVAEMSAEVGVLVADGDVLLSLKKEE